MKDVYGVSRARFEVFTLGTLAIIVVIGVAGYIAGAGVRARTVPGNATLVGDLGLEGHEGLPATS
jgi:hypothetical protein